MSNVTLGAEGEEGKGSFLELVKISFTPNSPVAKELMKDEQMKKAINGIRLGAGTIVGGVLLLAVLKKRKKKKSKLGSTKTVYLQKTT